MKIKSFEVDNHPILGTFSFDFEDDKPITLLVGKNGSGKTRFLEFMHSILDKSFRVWEIPEWNTSTVSRIKMAVELSETECSNIAQVNIEGNLVWQSIGSGDVYFEATQKTQGWGDIEVYMRNGDGVSFSPLPIEFKKSLAAEKPFAKILHDKTRYSSIQINFGYKPVTSFSDIPDDDKKIQTKSTEALADEINRLLVSTYYRDKVTASQKYETGEINPVETKYKGDFDRFKDAYAQLFETKEIFDIKPDGTDNKIVVRDTVTDAIFGIDGLSSGEQQVVYRVGYLLKHLNIKMGGIVFIDEPELSLHPRWQEGYVPFLKSIFGDDIQFVIATHSPYIVKSGIDDESVSISKLSIELRNLLDNKMHHTSQLGRATFAEVNFKAFDIASEELHTELYLALQRVFSPESYDAIGKKYVGGRPHDLDTVLRSAPHNIPVHITWTEVGTNVIREETRMTFIRNIIHHGQDAIDRGRGREYTDTELKQSIEEMLGLL